MAKNVALQGESMKKIVAGIAVLLVAALFAPRARGQEHVNIGAYADYFRWSKGGDVNLAGVGGRVSVNIAPIGRLMQEVGVPAQMLNLRSRARALPSVLLAMQRERHPNRLLAQGFSHSSAQVGVKASARALKIFPGYASFLPRVNERFLSCVHYLPQNTREAWDLEDRHRTFVVAAQMHT